MAADRRTTAKKTPAANKPAAVSKPAAPKKAATATKPAATKATVKRAAPARKPAARKPAAKRAASAPGARVAVPPAERRSKRTSAARSSGEAARDVALFDNLGGLADLLAEHLVLTTARLQETMDDAVRRGRMLPDDATELGQRLSHAGRRQLSELLAEAEQRLRRR